MTSSWYAKGWLLVVTWQHHNMKTLSSLLALWDGDAPVSNGFRQQKASDAYPDSKVHGAYMGPIWGRQDPGGPHVGSMNFAIWVAFVFSLLSDFTTCCTSSQVTYGLRRHCHELVWLLRQWISHFKDDFEILHKLCYPYFERRILCSTEILRVLRFKSLFMFLKCSQVQCWPICKISKHSHGLCFSCVENNK